jgi:hypothetical protein
MIDGTEMTAQQIADMLGCTLNALQSRKCRLGGISYQALVNMWRENQFGFGSDGKVPRYLVEGRWMTRRQIAEMLEGTGIGITAGPPYELDAKGMDKYLD